MSVTPFNRSLPAPFVSRDQSWTVPAVPLGESIRNLARTLRATHAATISDRTWRDQVRCLLDPLREAFAAHRAATEGDAGIYAEVVFDAPRLAGTVDGLVAEHRAIDSAMARLVQFAGAEEVAADAELLRRRALDVLDELTRHGQHDADLVYEAYATDIGGE